MKVKFNFFHCSIFMILFGLVIFSSCKDDDDDETPPVVIKMKYPATMQVITHQTLGAPPDTVKTAYEYNAKKQLTKMTVYLEDKALSQKDTITHSFDFSASTDLLEKETVERKSQTLRTFAYVYHPITSTAAGLLHTRTETVVSAPANTRTIGDVETFEYNADKTIKLYTRENVTPGLNQKVYYNYNSLFLPNPIEVVDTLTVASDQTVSKLEIIKFQNPLVYNSFYKMLYGYRPTELGNPYISYFQVMPMEATLDVKASGTNIPVTLKYEYNKLVDVFPEEYIINKVQGINTALFQSYKITYTP